MAKCFLTGIEIQLESAYVLDQGAAKRALCNLRQRIAAVERLVSQLTPKDTVEVFDHQAKAQKTRSETRLVCQTVAAALSVSCPEIPLFKTWSEFISRRRAFLRQPPASVAGKSAPADKGVRRDRWASVSASRPENEDQHASAQ